MSKINVPEKHPTRLTRGLPGTAAVAGFLAAALLCASARAAEIRLDASSPGRTFEGVGALSAGASTRLLFDYPEPQRSQILDFLFQPRFGAGFQHLRVEIGGDVNSTVGTEPSHARTRQETEQPKPEYFRRGYEWWLMKEARKRNPDIIISVLQWGAPGWIGGDQPEVPDGGEWKSVARRKFFTRDNAEFIAGFIKSARDIHGVRVDYAGIWNESPFDREWIKLLRRTLDGSGLREVKIVAADQTGGGAWDIATEMLKDPGLMRVVDVIGGHYPGKHAEQTMEASGPEDKRASSASAAYERFASRPQALETGKPIWASEDGPWASAWKDLPYLIKAYNRNYVDGKMTCTIIWPLITSHYDWLRHADAGAMRAVWPWCGHYEVQDAIWVTAHTTQFAAPGWRYLDDACGRLPGKGSYVTLLKPGTTGDYSLVIETLDAADDQAATIHLGPGLSRKPLRVWSSNAKERFVRQADIVPAGDRFEVQLAPGTLLSLSTLGGQQKGDVAGVPAERQFPFPHREDFESYAPGALAKYLADQSGSFEVATRPNGPGRCYRQTVPRRGIWWHYPNPEPATLLGDKAWRDYAVSCDVWIEGRGSVALYGRVARGITIDYKDALPPRACRFSVTDDGSWTITGYQSVLARGTCAFSAESWHRLRLEFQGEQIRAYVDGVKVGEARNTAYARGAAGFGSGWNYARFDNFAIEALPQTAAKGGS